MFYVVATVSFVPGAMLLRELWESKEYIDVYLLVIDISRTGMDINNSA